MNCMEMLLTAALAMPLVMLATCLAPRVREHVLSLLALAPVPALIAALVSEGSPSLTLPSPFSITLELDRPGAILLGAAALLWIAAGAYAATYMRGKPNGGRFAAWWLLTLTGNIGVFMAADVASFYFFYAMAGLSAYGLVVHDGSTRARRAGFVYVGFALLGEACVLMGLVQLVAVTPVDNLSIRDAVAALSDSPWRNPALALLIVGFGLKIGLVPLHVWMPLAYSAAPIPAAAVLSGAAVKVGVIGLIRVLPFDAGQPDWGEALAVVGLFSAFYGVAIGITQSNPKTVLAYSSVSQMGLIAAVIGMGLAAGDYSAVLAAAFYAAHHVLVKGALFLAIGVAASTRTRTLWLVTLPAGLIALGLAGLPFTGGALAKLAVKAPLGEGLVGTLAALAAAGTALLMLHFLQCLATSFLQDRDATPPAGLTVPWLGMALASLVVPWAMFPSIIPGGLSEIFSIGGFWSALWPVLLGAVLAMGLRRSQNKLPQVPEGDIAIVLDGATRRAISWGAAFERADVILRQWQVAGVFLLVVTVVLGAAIAAGN